MGQGVLQVGVTGHIGMTPGSVRPVYLALTALLRSLLRHHEAVHGVTCLARGADRLFARAVRDVAGTYEVVLPGPPDGGRQTRRLLRQAHRVSRVAADPRPEQRYAAASEEMLRRCDVLVAVWDGTEHGVRGGTAYTVARARALGKPVHVVWPAGASRIGAHVGGGSMSHSNRAPSAAARTSG